MSTPGLKKMLIGGGIAAVGGLLTLATYSAAASSSDGGRYVVFYGAIGVGALQFVVGAFQFLIYTMKSPEARERDDTVLGIRLLVNAMISVSYADGEVDESEVNTIAAIVNRLTDQYIDPQQITDLASEMQKSDTSVADAIDDYRGRLPAGFDELIVRACHLVAMADGDVSEPESIRIDTITRALRLDGARVAQIVAQVNP